MLDLRYHNKGDKMTKTEFREAVFTLEELATTCLNDSPEKDNVFAIIDQLLEEAN